MRPSLPSYVRWLLPLIVLLVLLGGTPTLAAASGKSYYAQGQNDYHAGHYAQAATEFEQAIANGYRVPGAYYLLGLSFSRLKQCNNTAWAFDMVLKLDPSFGRLHPTLAKKLTEAKQHGGADQGPPPGLAGTSGNGVAVTTNTNPSGTNSIGATSSNPSGPGAPQAAVIANTLTGSSVYLDPVMAARVGPIAVLQSTASDLQQHSSTMVRFAFVHAIPAPYTSLGSYAYGLFDRLGLKHAVVIVVSPDSVAARTDRLSQSETQSLVNNSLPQFLQGSYVSGADTLARAIVSRADSNDNSAKKTRIAVILVIVVAVLAFLAFLGIGRVVRWRAAYREATTWRDSLSQLVADTSNHIDVLPSSHPARQTFLTASAYYSTASRILDQLPPDVNLSRALIGLGKYRKALGQARANLQGAERTVQEADAQASGKPSPGVAQGAPGGEVLPQPQFLDHASGNATPTACFFCAKPLDPAIAAVVQIPVGNGFRRVMACDEHAADVRAGRQPQVRAVPDPARGGQMAPWWGVPSYNPSRDYVYDPYYYRGGGIGWGDLLLYDALFQRGNTVYIDDDTRWDDQGTGYGGDSDRPDSASFEAAGRDVPSAAEASFGTSGYDSSGDQS